MGLVRRAHEWLADHVSWIQYPRPRVRSLSGHPHGFRAIWRNRPPMNKALAICAPTLALFLPYVGVYLSIACVVFLFAYFNRHW